MGYLTGKGPTENFDFIKELHRSALEQAHGLARWVMASLLLINGGALVALTDAAATSAAVADAGTYFVWGVIFALLCGILAWFNFNIVAETTSERLNWEELNATNTPRADTLDRIAQALAGLAIAFAFGSLIMFSLGARHAGSAMHSRPAMDQQSPIKANRSENTSNGPALPHDGRPTRSTSPVPD